MSPWTRALHVEYKASNCPETATANRLGMLPVPDMCDHVKGPLGLKRHACVCLPGVPPVGAWKMTPAEAIILYSCCST